ncbi:MAG: hypothetical protein UY49_C0008G0009 [Microgenomates group bacterium GW2011_GWC1_49_7]|nr:MAG: hypothetical protein UY49_C0008G0009 [Microgenomates group bacterium GW2011_GWC1_49_7]
MKGRKIHYRHHRHQHGNHRHYKNIAIVTMGILFAIFLSRVEGFHELLLHLGTLGYVGAFIAGMFFVSTFTVATGTLMLIYLTEQYSPLEIGLIAGAGAVLSDTIIFHVVKDDLLEDIMDIYNRFGGGHLTRLLHTRYFHWTLPVLGALIIASPLPDELGVSLMGISKMKPLQFTLISFILNFIGIFLVVSAAVLIID